ncbi:MAG TPA: transposase, partial [Candidatus Dormibacteraeota bacterium]|nr:transposase [Candidatus Dormibacteraeota bacterium]
MARKYAAPDGWTLQAFQFALDPTPEQWQVIRRQWGGRRYAYNWAIRTLKADLDAYRESGESKEPPSFYGLRWRWNRAKATECVDQETGEVWWPQISKEAFANGIKDAVDAYWRWQRSRAGKLDGCRVGFPRFKRKGRDPDRCTFSTGPLRVEPDRRHVTLPKIGTVRTCESTRRLERLVRLGWARILAATLKRVGERAVVVFRVEIQRPQHGHPDPASTVGVDVGVRWLATVATAEAVIERVPNPAPLARNLTMLRRLSRSISRSQRGSNRCRRK